jgi:hypothetical protein
VELSEGCNLYCSFCGLQGIREKKEKNFKFMEESTLRCLMKQMVELKWNPRVEFAMHGEPTMHPDFAGMVRAAREVAPRLQLMMTSNAGGLMRKPGPAENVESLFRAGLNVLALDDYEGVNFVGKVREACALSVKEDANSVLQKVRFYEYPAQPLGNPHSRVSHTEMKVSYIQSIDEAKKGTHSHLNNHAGAAAPLNDRMAGKRCAKPFREMSVRWDGNVAVCCNDWRGHYKCGSVLLEGVEGVWHGEAMTAARQKLVLGQRDFGPCRGCDAMSHRVGLLPDKFGKVTLPLPDKSTDAAIAAALAGKPYATPILREWER